MNAELQMLEPSLARSWMSFGVTRPKSCPTVIALSCEAMSGAIPMFIQRACCRLSSSRLEKLGCRM